MVLLWTPFLNSAIFYILVTNFWPLTVEEVGIEAVACARIFRLRYDECKWLSVLSVGECLYSVQRITFISLAVLLLPLRRTKRRSMTLPSTTRVRASLTSLGCFPSMLLVRYGNVHGISQRKVLLTVTLTGFHIGVFTVTYAGFHTGWGGALQ